MIPATISAFGVSPLTGSDISKLYGCIAHMNNNQFQMYGCTRIPELIIINFKLSY